MATFCKTTGQYHSQDLTLIQYFIQISPVLCILTRVRVYLVLYNYIRYVAYKLWKILEEMGKPDHLTCLLRNLYAGQEATVRTGHGTTDWFQIGKGVCQGYILSPCFFNL